MSNDSLSAELSDCSSGVYIVVLTPADIPRVDLSEPYEAHAIPGLKRWLLCRGIKAQTSWKKKA